MFNWIRYYVSVILWWVILIALIAGACITLYGGIVLPGFICGGATMWWLWYGVREE